MISDIVISVNESIPAFINAGLAFVVALLHLRFYRSGKLFRTKVRLFSMLAWTVLGLAYTIAQLDPPWWCCGFDRIAFRLSIFVIAATEVMRNIRHYSILVPLMEASGGD